MKKLVLTAKVVMLFVALTIMIGLGSGPAAAVPIPTNPQCGPGQKIVCAWLGDGGPWICACVNP